MNDYISRELAITMCPHIAIDTLKKIPAADVVERKTGKWKLITQDNGWGEYKIYKCDQCGALSARNRNYCYDCGAKMKKR